MNLYNLFKIISARLHSEYQSERPKIKVYDNKLKKNVSLELFSDPSYILDDLRMLSDFWSNLVPNCIVEQIKISEWLVGKRHIDDMLLLMEWLSDRKSIDKCDFQFLLQFGSFDEK